MTTPQQVKLRQLIWAEYRAENNENQALVNINAKFGPKAVSQSIIHDCYTRFQSGDTNLFDRHYITNVVQTLSDGNEVKNF
jgi:hypothetical protein